MSIEFYPSLPRLSQLGVRRLLLANIDHHLGNLLLTLPVIQAVAERFPGDLEVIVDERYADFLRLFPGPMRILEYPAQGTRRRGIRANCAPAVLVAGMWRRSYDAVLDLYGGTRSVALGLGTFARVRIGYKGHTTAASFYTHFLQPPAGIHEFERYCFALRVLDDARPPTWPLLTAPEAAGQRVEDRLKADFGPDDQRPILVLHPGAGHEYRLWPADRFGRVCARLIDRFGMRLVVIGTAKERELMQKVLAAMGELGGSARIWTVPLLDLLALFGRSRMILSNESGPTHLASMTALPIVTIFGPTAEHLWRPVRREHVSIVRGEECETGCRHGRCVSQWRCLKSLDEEQVFAEAKRLCDGVRGDAKNQAETICDDIFTQGTGSSFPPAFPLG